ncbi:TPA: hypothetical protein BOS_9758 [Bos taurus]|uniref:Uncharacterized protein n=1 Tax=Bos taurus TaxID=9913 RepID=B5AGS8_BOVIN|nr:hypothetical protein [Bos taurus]DAA26183.1 TPA: hypothetical protein BOS_9758 [Bos taurus]
MDFGVAELLRGDAKMQRYISKHAGQYWLENDLVKT